MTTSATYVITARTMPSDVPDICRLRRYLKAMGRRMGLKVIEVREIGQTSRFGAGEGH